MGFSFVKMQALGNDMIVIDDRGRERGACAPLDADLARRLGDRRRGVGTDQILWLRDWKGDGGKTTEKFDAEVVIFNADGSQAEMCGNGLRCVGLYLYGRKPQRSSFRVMTAAGPQRLDIESAMDEGRDRRGSPRVRVEMGIPDVRAEPEKLRLPGTGKGPGGGVPQEVLFYRACLGNPHAVVFVERVDTIPLEQIGPQIENHPAFRDRTNVEFVEVLKDGTLKLRVWERGAGATLACGSGACAAAAVSIALLKVPSPVLVRQAGGDLRVEWAGPGQPLDQIGPAEEVYRGEFSPDSDSGA